MPGTSFFNELKRRKVVRVAAAYLAAGLGVVYAADTILPRVGLPDWTVTLVIILVGLGLPIAIGLAWAFDMTDQGVVRTAPVDTPAAEAPIERPHATLTSRPGIVVLPFDDMSPDSDHEHLSDGITEEISADLAGLKALRVISRTSAMRFKKTEKDIPTIGRELGVRYAIEGSVRKAGDSLRITAQLIDAETDEHLWADKYDGTVSEVFDLQERVAREIVRALDLTISSDEDRRLSQHPVADARAFELYLRARQQLQRYSTDGVSELLAEAIAIEGETPPLLALTAWARVNEVRTGMNRDMRPLDEAMLIADRLRAVAPNSHSVHALLGYIAYERGDLPGGVRHFKASLEIEPNDADALFYTGIAYNGGDQTASAGQISRRLLACDPLSPMAHLLSGIVPWFDGHREEALPGLLRALELDPANLIARWTMAYLYAMQGELDQAAPHVEWMGKHGPRVPYTLQVTSLVEGMAGNTDRALEILATLDTDPLDAHNTYHVGESFAMAGDTGRALELVEKAVVSGFYPYRFIAEYCPFMEPLRGLPEFTRILETAKRRVDEFGDA
jgi:adenylate cyclase